MCRVVDRLDLARRRLARCERGDVARQARQVSPPLPGDGRDRSDPEAEVVAAVPVAEVVQGAEIPSVRTLAVEAEVRRLVPAVARCGQRLDDLLEVALHRVGLPRELVPVRDGEARSRLRLELVAGEVLRLEPQRLVEVGVEVGGALAGDAVDEIERDVVESGLAKSSDGASDVVGRSLALEHPEQVRLEALRAERDAGHAVRAQQGGDTLSHRLRVRLDRHLVRRGGKRPQQPLELGRLGEGRRAAAEEDRLEVTRQRAALQLELGEQRVDVGRVLAAPADHGHEVAVAAPMRAERQVDVEVPDVAHG